MDKLIQKLPELVKEKILHYWIENHPEYIINKNYRSKKYYYYEIFKQKPEWNYKLKNGIYDKNMRMTCPLCIRNMNIFHFLREHLDTKIHKKKEKVFKEIIENLKYYKKKYILY
jgi:hypothetical protein